MRLLVLAMVAWGCSSPPVPPEAPPELRVLSQELASPPGERVDLGLLSGDCATHLSLRLQNVGLRAADLVVSGAPELLDLTPSTLRLAPGEGAVLRFRVWPSVTADSRFEASLVVSAGVHELRFPLLGTIVTTDWDWPSRVDFGGVQVGAPASVGTLELSGLSAPFSYDEGLRQLQFFPTAPGPFQQRATIVRRADCTFRPSLVIAGDGVTAQLTGPSQVSFPDTAVGSSSEQDVVIENLAALLGGTSELRPPGGTDFSLGGAGALTNALREADGGLAPGTTTLRVRFSPAAANARTGELWLTSGSAHLLIPLSGLGTPQ